jgi:hypothetical protein
MERQALVNLKGAHQKHSSDGMNMPGIKQRRSILQLVLADDANCLKSNPVLFDSMAETQIKALKGLEPSIERLVAGSSATFELL